MTTTPHTDIPDITDSPVKPVAPAKLQSAPLVAPGPKKTEQSATIPATRCDPFLYMMLAEEARMKRCSMGLIVRTALADYFANQD